MSQYPIDKYVEQRLSQWAGWYLAIFDRIGNYPDRTTEFRLMEVAVLSVLAQPLKTSQTML
jgi:hypothetical protein